jgi:hypothetical protein
VRESVLRKRRKRLQLVARQTLSRQIFLSCRAASSASLRKRIEAKRLMNRTLIRDWQLPDCSFCTAMICKAIKRPRRQVLHTGRAVGGK